MDSMEITTISPDVEENIEPGEKEESIDLEGEWLGLSRDYLPVHDFDKEIHVEHPEEMVEIMSQSILDSLPHIHDNIQFEIDNISLLTKIARDYQLRINNESSLYKLYEYLAEIEEVNWDDFGYSDLATCGEALAVASNLLSEVSNIDLPNKLLEMSEDAYSILENDEDRSPNEGLLFYPDGTNYVWGEEKLYNHEYCIFTDEDPLFTKYNVYSERNEHYFKSCGLYLKIQRGVAEIHFKPLGKASNTTKKNVLFMQMAYRGIKNYVHAVEEGEIEEAESFFGSTNPEMARIATKMGFKIELSDGLYGEEDIKAKRLQIESGRGYNLVANINDIKAKIVELEEKGIPNRFRTIKPK